MGRHASTGSTGGEDEGAPTLREWLRDARDGAKRAYREFLRTPTFMVSGFLILAVALYLLDRGDIGMLDPVREPLKTHLFIDSDTTSDFLSAIAAGIISVTSITISLLLLAVQQSAGSMTSAVLDQFLRRKRNQAYFGYFIGLALYCLVVLSTVHESSNAVLAATVGFALTLVALYLLILLLYSTIHQMRPAVIVAAITDHTLRARQAQCALLHRTRRVAQLGPGVDAMQVRAERGGYLMRVDLDALAEHLQDDAGVEVVLDVQIGSFVTRHDVLAHVRGAHTARREEIAEGLLKALVFERHRGMDGDPEYGVGQLARIAWVTISTAKSSPGPATHAIHAMRKLLVRLSDEPPGAAGERVLPLVYRDTLVPALIDALESAAVACSESRQHQSLAEILRTFVVTVPRLRAPHGDAMTDMVDRVIPTIGEHVLTGQLCSALEQAAATLSERGRADSAARIRNTPDRLGRCLAQVRSGPLANESG